MKIVKVTYTTQQDFVAQNQLNISKVMTDLQEGKHEGIHYHTCLSSDHKTFIHTAFFQTDDDQVILNELPSFKLFQEQLKASGLESPPTQELLTLVGTSYPLFTTK